MKTTNIILTACLAGGLLLGSAGCPGSDKGTQAQRLQSDAGMGTGEEPKAAAKSEAGNTVANDGQPELIREARAGDFEAVKALIKAGADVNAKDRDGKTALMVSSGGVKTEIGDACNPKMMKALIAAGADVKAKDKAGNTALHFAAGNSFDDGGEVVRVLLKAGADVNAADNSGATPLLVLTSLGYEQSILQAQLEIAGELLKAGADVNAKTQEGETALLQAAEGGHVELVKALIQAGADVNAKDRDGQTALMAALKGERENADAVRLLIEAKADVNAKDKSGKTALDVAKTDEIKELLKAAAVK
jgi:FOG: Ankyrin repeat